MKVFVSERHTSKIVVEKANAENGTCLKGKAQFHLGISLFKPLKSSACYAEPAGKLLRRHLARFTFKLDHTSQHANRSNRISSIALFLRGRHWSIHQSYSDNMRYASS
ncbi:hypothetical protein ASG68_24160 [Rhizobium sp. Leaf453]|nr:hypothetical protein ASG68_24160 [Rhizobium sp. Leaf453]